MTIRPIRNKEEHIAALKRIEAIWGAEPATPEGDELDVLTMLVDAYETEQFPVPPPTAIEAIEFRMEQQGLTRKDLEALIGSRARVSEIFSGKRALTLPMIRRLHASLQIPLESLIAAARPKPRTPSKRRKHAVSPSRQAPRRVSSQTTPRTAAAPATGRRSRAA